ncbi:MAG: FHA domain-containing protein, partial [Polyangiaceae bacterium]
MIREAARACKHHPSVRSSTLEYPACPIYARVIPVDDVTETITPTSTRAVLPAVVGVVALYTEGVGAISRPVAVRQRVTAGRGDAADLVLDDKKASRLHAAFEPAAHGVTVRDLGSRNGTTVSG